MTKIIDECICDRVPVNERRHGAERSTRTWEMGGVGCPCPCAPAVCARHIRGPSRAPSCEESTGERDACATAGTSVGQDMESRMASAPCSMATRGVVSCLPREASHRGLDAEPTAMLAAHLGRAWRDGLRDVRCTCKRVAVTVSSVAVARASNRAGAAEPHFSPTKTCLRELSLTRTSTLHLT